MRRLRLPRTLKLGRSAVFKRIGRERQACPLHVEGGVILDIESDRDESWLLGAAAPKSRTGGIVRPLA
jgi:hypothetical protein